jgi:pimeloyl-ACP methyl ester carboxylesterase
MSKTHVTRIEVKEMQPQIGTPETEHRPQFLMVGADPVRRIAYLRRSADSGAETRAGLIWLGGFMSNMASTKASFLDQYAAREARAYVRFDYSGHGQSGGRFEDGTIGVWLEESLAILRAQSSGPQILVGSSMGGWLALLCARALMESGEAERLAGLVLIAPAVDFTERLIFAKLSPQARALLQSEGRCLVPSTCSEQPYPITRGLIEEGRRHLMLDATIRTHCPIHILQGMRDEDVPWQYAMTLVEHLAGDPVVLSLVKDADHRLSRETDLALLAQAIETVAERR